MAPQNGSTPNFLKAVKIQILPPKIILFVFSIMQHCLIWFGQEEKKVEKILLTHEAYKVSNRGMGSKCLLRETCLSRARGLN